MNKIMQGDSLTVLKTLPNDYIDCCITSPPYWGLRDYGVEGQLGLEKTPEEYVANMVKVFQEVKRILKPEGTLWLNLGDSYWGGGWRGSSLNEKSGDIQKGHEGTHCGETMTMGKGQHPICKPKDLVGIPWRVAFALQADGWYLRQDIIWHKPNPMPESVTDRCTKAHEYIFLMAKSQKYFFDNELIKEDSVDPESFTGRRFRSADARRTGLYPQHFDKAISKTYERRNKRSVWKINVSSLSEAHFATYPEELIAPMIMAGCPVGGVCLDPFFGAGTTGLVAKKLGRNYIGIELNPAYVEMAQKRIANIENSLFTTRSLT